MALVNPNIALSVKPLELPQRNAMADYGNVLQIQQAQMQMDKLRKTDEALERIRQAAMQHGGPDNLADIAKAYMQSPDAGHQELGLKILQQERDKQAFNTMFGADFDTAAPGAAAAPAPTNALVAPGAAPAMPAAPANAMVAPSAAPAAAPAAAPINAMIVQSPEQTIRRQIMQYSQLADPRAKVVVKQLEDQLKSYEPTELQRNYRAAKAEGFAGNLADFKVLATPKTTNILNAPVPKSLAAPVGARAEASLVKAEASTGMMENANLVRDALNSGNVIAGPLAGPRLKFQQVLDIAGAGDKEKLMATRNAIQGLAAMTLESRAELKGQGQVTENEQKLLERARSGNVEDMTVSELQTIVDTSQRLANRMWSNHQTLLKTMKDDPNAAESLRYYQPTSALPQALTSTKPAAKAETDKRKAGLAEIFGSK